MSSWNFFINRNDRLAWKNKFSLSIPDSRSWLIKQEQMLNEMDKDRKPKWGHPWDPAKWTKLWKTHGPCWGNSLVDVCSSPDCDPSYLQRSLSENRGPRDTHLWQRAVTESMTSPSWHHGPHSPGSRCKTHSGQAINVSHCINSKKQAIKTLLLFSGEHFQNELCAGCPHTHRSVQIFF